MPKTIKKAAVKKAAPKRKAPAKKAAASRTEPAQGALFASEGAEIEGIEESRLLLPLHVCALAFGISTTAFLKWKVKPRMKRGREQLYYLPDAITYRMQRADNADNTLSAERANLAKFQAQKTELEVAEKRGQLIPADKILETWQPLITATRQKVLSIKTKIKTQIPSLTKSDVKKIEVICRSTLEDLANHGGLPRGTRRAKKARV